MNLAQKMREKALADFDDGIYESFKSMALKQIDNVAGMGRRSTEIYLEGVRFYTPDDVSVSINERITYWNTLKYDLEIEGFDVSMGHYTGIGRYGYALDVKW